MQELGEEFFEDNYIQDASPPPPENIIHPVKQRVRILSEKGREQILNKSRKIEKALLADDRRRERTR